MRIAAEKGHIGFVHMLLNNTEVAIEEVNLAIELARNMNQLETAYALEAYIENVLNPPMDDIPIETGTSSSSSMEQTADVAMDSEQTSNTLPTELYDDLTNGDMEFVRQHFLSIPVTAFYDEVRSYSLNISVPLPNIVLLNRKDRIHFILQQQPVI